MGNYPEAQALQDQVKAEGSEKLNFYVSPKLQATPGKEEPQANKVRTHNAIDSQAETNLAYFQKNKIFKDPKNGFLGPYEFTDASSHTG